jgi:hypothetical protein
MNKPLVPRHALPVCPRWLTLGSLLTASSLCLDAAVVQRWSFNAPSGPAPAETAVPNEVAGGEAAVVRGAGAAMFSGTVKLPGGSSATAGYVDLPNGIISSLTECTIEGWMSVDVGGYAWGRAFDFGDSLGVEVTGPGGGGEGRDYLTLSVSRGADYNVQRLEWRNETPGGPGPGGATTLDSGVPTTFGQSFHYAVTVKPDGAGGSLINYWRNGELISVEAPTPFVLADVNDVNNWLGRSNWTGDSNTAGSFDEFRIHDVALSDTEIESSRLAGPDAGLPDTDSDGILDFFELQYPTVLNPANPADAVLDGDSDGLNNLGEFQRRTNPTVADTDGDGLADGAEVTTHNTNPTVVDTDADGLPDGQEITLGTNPLVVDTDGDSFSDGLEVAQGTDPKNPASVPLLLLVNRYGFNETGGSDSRTVVDTVGESPGAILGDGFAWNGTDLVLDGGSSATAAYVDLPNRFVSRHARANGGSGTITIEGWVTVTDSAPGWARLFDFGSSAPTNVEILGPGGGGEGRDYLMFTAYNGNDANTRQLDWRNEDPAGGGGVVGAYATSTFGSEFHFVITVDEIAKKASAYENGVKTTEVNLNWGLGDVNDINCWLGRSNWTADGNLAGTFNEFRLYSGLMSETQIAANTAAGPNVVPVYDTDGDGMPDWYELRNGLNRNNPADAASDSDGDGLSALGEYQRRTNPAAPDTDGDGLTDGAEVNTHNSDPNVVDTDADGLSDGQEVTLTTNPTNPDTDGDSFSDGNEVAQGTDPKNPSSVPLLLLVHRYGFNETNGSTSRTVTDAVGGAAGTILGDGYSWDGTKLVLTGGSSDTAAYVDLPNGYISRHARANGGSGTVTLEGWVTVTESTPAWPRIFDFGSSQPTTIEITGPGNTNGGSVEGRDYLMFTGYNGNDPAARQLDWRNEDPHRGGAVVAAYTTATFGSEFHFVVTVDEVTKKAMVYENGIKTTEMTIAWELDDLNDNNCWLGRSNWTADGNLAGSYNEFRVYSGLMTPAQISTNATAGPDGSVPVFDTDSDGMPDWYELRYGLNRNSAADATTDGDGDTLTALAEYQRGSRPNAADSDADGLPDVAETNTGLFVGPANTGSNPGRADSDGDGANDGAEVTAGSNPLLFDTDADGVSDMVEIAQGSNPSSTDPAFPPLAHRWAFNNPAGAANNGDSSPDLAGTEPAFIRGNGASFTGNAVELPGGPSASAPYVDLANGIFSSRRVVTVEGWYSVANTANVWGRVFDFGNSAGLEQTSPGGGGEGFDYLALTASRGTNYDQQRLEWRDEFPAGGGAITFDSDVITPIGDGTLIHFVVTIDNSLLGSTILNYWRDGEIRTANAAFPGNLGELNDVNNWLGRSNWAGDANLAGGFDEFRVYDGVLNDAAVKANLAAGPNVPPDGSTPSNFAIVSVTRDPATGAITLTWSSEPGKSYVVQQSLTLATAGWNDIPGTVASGGTTTSVTITPSAGQTVQYYRVKLP